MESSSTSSSWPMHKIAEIHDSNDVVLEEFEENFLLETTPPDASTSGVSTTPTFRMGGPTDASISSLRIGNSKFHQLLLEYQEEYASKNSMEKPLITVQILKRWRDQTPTGRFLVAEKESTLWKDIGDKKARSRISKFLKKLTTTTQQQQQHVEDTGATINSQQDAGNNRQEGEMLLTGAQQSNSSEPIKSGGSSSGTVTTTASSSSAGGSYSQEEDNTAKNTPLPPLTMGEPSATIRLPPRPETTGVRRSVSQALQKERLSRKKLYGRQKEYDQLNQIFQHRQAGIIDLILIKGPMGVGKTALANHYLPTAAAEAAKLSEFSLHEHYDVNHANEQTAPTTIFLKTQFEQYKWNLPNSVFVDLVTDFCQQIQQRNDTTLLTRYQKKIQCSFKEDLHLLMDLVPALQTFMRLNNRPTMMGDSSCRVASFTNKSTTANSTSTSTANTTTTATTTTSEAYENVASQRIQSVFNTFFRAIVYATPPHYSIVVLLEDIQYASEAALRIFRNVVSGEDSMTKKCNVNMNHYHHNGDGYYNHHHHHHPHPHNMHNNNNNHTNITFCITQRTDYKCKPYLSKFLEHARNNSSNNSVLRMHEIGLDNIDSSEIIQRLLSDALQLVEHETKSLCDLVMNLTKGNPSFIMEILRSLQERGLLYYDDVSHQWTCDLADIVTEGDPDHHHQQQRHGGGVDFHKIHSVLDLWKAKVMLLPPETIRILQYASCLLCPMFSEKRLALITQNEPTTTIRSHLELAEAKGLILRRTIEDVDCGGCGAAAAEDLKDDTIWMFASDGVRQGIYEMIPEVDRPAQHLKIGQRIWGHCEANDCVLLMQLWMGHHLVTQEEDIRTVATIFLNTGKNAAKHVGFQTSWYALSAAIAMVSSLPDTWGRNNYDLSLNIYNTAIEVCFFNGEFSEELQRLIDEVMEHARTFEDSLIARSTLVKTLGTHNKKGEAIELAVESLNQLDERFPAKPTYYHVWMQYRKIRRLLKGLSDDDILQLPRMRNQQKVAAQQMMSHSYNYICYESHPLSALVAFRMVELTIKFGLSGMSAMAFSVYSMALVRFDYEESYRYGKLALKICDLFKRDVWFSRSAAAFYGIAFCRKKPVKDTIEPLANARKAALRAGDIEFALLNGSLEIWNVGMLMSLPDVERKCRELSSEASYHGQSLSIDMIEPLWQFSLNMMGSVEGDPKVLQLSQRVLTNDKSKSEKKVVDDQESEEKEENSSYTQLVMWVRFYSMKLAYLFGDIDLATTHVNEAHKIYRDHEGHITGAFSLTYECLVRLAQARQARDNSGLFRSDYWYNVWKVRQLLKKLKSWTVGCPENFLDKQCLLEAELAWTLGNYAKAHSRYRLAIVQSRDQGFWLEEAVANEQLGKLFLCEKDEESAIPYLRESQRIFEKWGASAKAQQMEEVYGDLWLS